MTTNEDLQPEPRYFPSGSALLTGGVDADNADAAGGGSGGLARGSALSFAGVWAGVSELPGGHSSTPHHHGDQATVVYVVHGHMTFHVHTEDGEDEVFTAGPGDFAAIPAGAVHAESNPSPDEPCLTVVVRTGEQPIVVNLDADT